MALTLVAVIAAAALVLASTSLALVVAQIVQRKRPRLNLADLGGMPVGTSLDASAFQGLLEPSAVDALLGQRAVIVFLSADCGACPRVVSQLNSMTGYMNGMPLLIVEPESSSLRDAAKFHATWIVDHSRRLSQMFQNRVTPTAYLLERGRVSDHCGGMEVDRLFAHRDALSASDGRSVVMTGPN
jgi:hypothetical protein